MAIRVVRGPTYRSIPIIALGVLYLKLALLIFLAELLGYFYICALRL